MTTRIACIPRSVFRGLRGRLPLVVPALVAAAPVLAQPPQVTVSGRVVEQTYATDVTGATVVLDDLAPFVTGRDGTFRFASVQAGRHVLVVQALGYARRELTLDLRADTSLVIELQVDPVHLDSLRAKGGDITLKGTVYDRETGHRIVDAQIFTGTGRRAGTKVNGTYRIGKVPVGLRISLDAGALGYSPGRVALVTARDTTIDFHLAPDSVSLRMIGEQVEKLHTRSNAVATALYVYDQDRLERMRGWTIADLLRIRRFNVGCLVVDEMALPRLEQRPYLDSFFTQEIQRIEVYDRGGMIRIYTKRYIGSLMGKQAEFPPIIYAGRWGLGSACF